MALQGFTPYNILWGDVLNEVSQAPGVLHTVADMPPIIVQHQGAHVNIGFPVDVFITPCLFVDSAHKPAAMTQKGHADDGVQYEYQWNRNQGVVGAAKDRVIAQRMYFINHPRYGAGVTVSHLCHRNACMNPAHMTIEPLPINKGRNGCAGGISCQHVVRCIMPGPSIFW